MTRSDIQTMWWPALLASTVLVISGCALREPDPGTDRYSMDQDAPPPPGERPDVHAMPEPQPRAEPRAAYGNHSPYTVLGETYEVLPEADGYRAEGIASWYGAKFHGYRTSSGEPFDMYRFTAAHRYLPLPSWVEVTNLDNDESLIVRVNDRGPFHPDREIDLSWAAAERLGIAAQGTGPVRVEVITPEPEDGGGAPRIAEEPVLIPVTGDTGGADAEESGQAGAEGYFLQAGVFSDPESARSLRDRLDRAFPWNTRIQAFDDDDASLYRVRLGPFESQAEQDAARQRISDAGHDKPMRIMP